MNKIRDLLLESAEVKRAMAENQTGEIEKAVELVYQCLKSGRKVLLMGNGGSAADAQHIAAEFVGRYKKERIPLPALALTVDTSALTCIGNDYGFENIFSRQVEALAQKGDVVIGISTSGNSENVIRAIQSAQRVGAVTIGLLGKGGGKLRDLVQLAIVVPSKDTARIQESHITLGHIICELVEDRMLAGKIQA